MLEKLQESHFEEIQAITEALMKITTLSAEGVKIYVDAMVEKLVKTTELPFHQTALDQEWIQALHEWSSSHKTNIPLLSDDAVSRAGIYEDEEMW